MQFRRGNRAVALVFPRKNVREILVVAERFPIWSLVFLAEMPAARFVTHQRVGAHQLGEFEKIGDSAGALQRLIKRFAFSKDPHVVPKFFTELWNAGERLFQSSFIPRHAAFVPEQKPELPMKRIHRAFSVYRE